MPAISSLKYLVASVIAGNGVVLKPQRYALPVAKYIEELWKKSVI